VLFASTPQKEKFMGTSLNLDMQLAFGEVVNVIPIRSRGVTRIEIEIPTEFHVPATQLLYGKPAVILPLWDTAQRSAYGVTTLGKLLHPAAKDARAERASDNGAAMFQNPRRDHDYVAHAGRLCRDDRAFWRVLANEGHCAVGNESEAAAVLCMLLGISSRRELQTNVDAQKLFTNLVASAKTGTPEAA
jgi:hypothetical protein